MNSAIIPQSTHFECEVFEWCAGHDLIPGERLEDEAHVSRDMVLANFTTEGPTRSRNRSILTKEAASGSDVILYDVLIDVEGARQLSALETLARELEALAVQLRTLAGGI